MKDVFKSKFDELKYVSAMHVAASMCNSETFSSIKNCNVGKEVALCGAGPTLKKYKPIDGVFHVALNRALLNDQIKYDWFGMVWIL